MSRVGLREINLEGLPTAGAGSGAERYGLEAGKPPRKRCKDVVSKP